MVASPLPATVTVKVTGAPIQVPTEGVAVKVERAWPSVGLLKRKLPIFPCPDPGSPLKGLSFVQLTTVLEGVAPQSTPANVAPSQYKFDTGSIIVGLGPTVMLIVLGVPVQVPNVGVTVITEVIEAGVLFTVVNDGIVPVPVEGIPIPGCVLVQPRTAFAGVPVMVWVGIVAPAQTL
jgi:hypothetical protein